jgi:hypothetical protein
MADLLGSDLGLAEAHKLYACHDLSLEVSVPIIKDYPVYNFKTEVRLYLRY